MNIAARPGYAGRYDGHDHHHWHGHALWHGGPALIGLMILGFIFCWPVGVALLALSLWSVKMRCGHHQARDWGERFQEKMEVKRARWEQRIAEHRERHHGRGHATSGNRAFDEYRAETLRRLEDEEREFREFLDQLRFAKDKVEFDQFLTNRRPPAPPASDPQPQPQT
jgi:hypothetical protein